MVLAATAKVSPLERSMTSKPTTIGTTIDTTNSWCKRR
jgi:hypothetical protein